MVLIDMKNVFFGAQALAQDQLRALVELLGEKSSSVGVGVYDGDTNQDLRLRYRDSARLVRDKISMSRLTIWWLLAISDI